MTSHQPSRTHRVDESVRLFENPLLEKLSHVHPIVPLLVWGPVAIWLIARAATVHGIGRWPNTCCIATSFTLNPRQTWVGGSSISFMVCITTRRRTRHAS